MQVRRLRLTAFRICGVLTFHNSGSLASAAAAAAAGAPTWVALRYEDISVGEQIGGGGVGLIHRGRLGREAVALKTLFDARVDARLKQEFLDEVLVLSRLRHPNIVKFLGANVQPPHLFFAMELCTTSLYNELHVHQVRFATAEKLRFAAQTASAMRYLHERSPPVIHRDLKSLNLLLTPDDSIRLCDFGLVHAASALAGTPAYMAPELLQNRSYNKAVDVYAFGMLLWELFTGDVPYQGFELTEIKEVVLSGERPAVPKGETPHQLRKLMDQCWSAASTDRPSFAECMELIDEAVSEAGQQSHLDRLTDDFGGDCLDSLLK